MRIGMRSATRRRGGASKGRLVLRYAVLLHVVPHVLVLVHEDPLVAALGDLPPPAQGSTGWGACERVQEGANDGDAECYTRILEESRHAGRMTTTTATTT